MSGYVDVKLFWVPNLVAGVRYNVNPPPEGQTFLLARGQTFALGADVPPPQGWACASFRGLACASSRPGVDVRRGDVRPPPPASFPSTNAHAHPPTFTASGGAPPPPAPLPPHPSPPSACRWPPPPPRARQSERASVRRGASSASAADAVTAVTAAISAVATVAAVAAVAATVAATAVAAAVAVDTTARVSARRGGGRGEVGGRARPLWGERRSGLSSSSPPSPPPPYRRSLNTRPRCCRGPRRWCIGSTPPARRVVSAVLSHPIAVGGSAAGRKTTSRRPRASSPASS